MKDFTKIFVVPLLIIIGLSIFAMINFNNHVFAQQQNGFDKELNLLNQAITALENQDKSAKKLLFDSEGIIEDKMKINPGIVNAEKRVEAAIKMVGEDNFQAAIDHAKEAIKTLNDLKTSNKLSQ